MVFAQQGDTESSTILSDRTDKSLGGPNVGIWAEVSYHGTFSVFSRYDTYRTYRTEPSVVSQYNTERTVSRGRALIRYGTAYVRIP